MTADALRPNDEELAAENTALRQRVAELEQRNAQLQARLGELEAALKTALGQLEAARRAGKRQAAPFSKGAPKEHPQRPGQKAGHPLAHREKPPQVDRTVEVTLTHATCPRCGGNLVDHTVQVQYQVEIPPVQPIVTQFNVEVARCAACGERFQARHPEQTSAALGAAAVQIGPRVLGLAAEFKHGLGVPDRKVEHVLTEALGLCGSPRARWRGRGSGWRRRPRRPTRCCSRHCVRSRWSTGTRPVGRWPGATPGSGSSPASG